MANPLNKQQAKTAWLLIAPTLLVLFVVILWPVLDAVRQSFYGVAGLNPETGFINDTEPFVLFDNYIHLFTEDTGRFWNAFYNTVLFGVITVAFEAVIGVGMALIMHKAMKGRAIVRASILIPWAIPTAVSAVLWKWIFQPNGAANALVGHQILWTTGDWTAKWAVIITDVWKTAPFVGLLTLAALQVINEDVYEAAKIDGAGPFRRFFSITLPLIRPGLVVAVLFRMLDALRMFDLPYILVGARQGSVETLSMLVQDDATNLRYGEAAASAIILFIFVFIVAFIFVRVLGADVIGLDKDHQKSKAEEEESKQNRTNMLMRSAKRQAQTTLNLIPGVSR